MSYLTSERLTGLYMNIVYDHVVVSCDGDTFRPIHIYGSDMYYISKFGPTEYEFPIVLVGDQE